MVADLGMRLRCTYGLMGVMTCGFVLLGVGELLLCGRKGKEERGGREVRSAGEKGLVSDV